MHNVQIHAQRTRARLLCAMPTREFSILPLVYNGNFSSRARITTQFVYFIVTWVEAAVVSVDLCPAHLQDSPTRYIVVLRSKNACG